MHSYYLRFFYVGLDQESNDFQDSYEDVRITRVQEAELLQYKGNLEQLYKLGCQYSKNDINDIEPQSITLIEIVDYTCSKHIYLYDKDFEEEE